MIESWKLEISDLIYMGTGERTEDIESLDHTLIAATIEARENVLWRDIPKSPAYSTYESSPCLGWDYEKGGKFDPEGELPKEKDKKTYGDDHYEKWLDLSQHEKLL